VLSDIGLKLRPIYKQGFPKILGKPPWYAPEANLLRAQVGTKIKTHNQLFLKIVATFIVNVISWQPILQSTCAYFDR